MAQPCALTVGELRKLVTKARRDNHLTGPANKEQLIGLFEAHAEVHEDVAQVLEGEVRVPMLKVQRVGADLAERRRRRASTSGDLLRL